MGFPTAEAAVGMTLTLNKDVGEGDGSIAAGTTFVVDAYVPADVIGAGPSDEDCIVVAWEEGEYPPTEDGEGNVVPAQPITRRWSISESQFEDLFEGGN